MMVSAAIVSIHKEKADAIFDDYHFFLVHKSTSNIIYSHNTSYRQFKDYRIASNYHGNMTIAIPKSNKLSTNGSHVLRKIFLEQSRSNPSACVNMNHYILHLINKQPQI